MIQMTHSNKAALSRLRRSWLVLGFLTLISFIGINNWLTESWGSANITSQWLGQSVIVFVWQWAVLWYALAKNHRLNESDLLPTFGAGNLLTILRSVLIAMLAGFLLLPRPVGILAWLPAGLYILSDLTDFLDGYFARRSDQVTELGKFLDMNNDSIGVLVVTFLAFQYGSLPWWYIWFGFARYFFIFGIWLRKRRGLPVYDLHPSFARRGFAGLQMGFITVMLFPVVGPPATYAAAGIFLAAFTGRFLYDWFQVSGKLDPERIARDRRMIKIKKFILSWLPLALRLLVVSILSVWIFEVTMNPEKFFRYYPKIGILEPYQIMLIFAIFEGIIMVTIFLGVTGRVISIIALITLGMKLQFQEFTFDYFSLIISFIGLLFLGTGVLSVWTPEEKLIFSRVGEKKES